jgi:hypothetical protein
MNYNNIITIFYVKNYLYLYFDLDFREDLI